MGIRKESVWGRGLSNSFKTVNYEGNINTCKKSLVDKCQNINSNHFDFQSGTNDLEAALWIFLILLAMAIVSFYFGIWGSW